MNNTPPTLATVDAFAVPELLVARIARLHQVPEDFAAGLLGEAKRMLFLCTLMDQSVAPSDRVDWAWHEMLMFTKWYQLFADHIGSFIHHVPNPAPGPDEKEETWEHIQATLGVPRRGSDAYVRTKAQYKVLFGEEPNPLYWP